MLCYAMQRYATPHHHTTTSRQWVTCCGFSSILIVFLWDFSHWKQTVFFCPISECQWGHGGVFLWCWARWEAVCQQTSWPLGTSPRRLLELWREFAGLLWYRGTKSSIVVNQTVRLKKLNHKLSFESRGRGADDRGVKAERELSRSAFNASHWKRVLRAKTFFLDHEGLKGVNCFIVWCP